MTRTERGMGRQEELLYSLLHVDATLFHPRLDALKGHALRCVTEWWQLNSSRFA